MFASTVVGAGVMPAAGATSSPPPPGTDGAPGFFIEQLQRAAVEAGNSGIAEETPAAASNALPSSPANIPVPVSVLPAGVTAPAIQISGADGNAQPALPLQGGVAFDISLIGRARSGRQGAATASDSVPASTRGSSRKASSDNSPDNSSPSAPINSFPPMSILPVGQNVVPAPTAILGNSSDVASQPSTALSATPPITIAAPTVIQTGSSSVSTKPGNSTDSDPAQKGSAVSQTPPANAFAILNLLPSNQNLTPAQVPATHKASTIDGQPAPAALPIRTAIHANALFTSNVGDLAFAARIKPSGIGGQTPAHSGNSIVTAGPAPQTGKVIGQPSAKQGNSGSEQQQDPSSQTPASQSSAAKPTLRKEEPADAASGVTGSKPVESNEVEPATANSLSGQPDATIPAQAVPQTINAAALNESRTTSAAPQGGAQVEQTHVLLDKPAQASSPARSISLQVEGPSGQTVDIRIASRSNDVNVAVRAGDDLTAQNLRQGLGDLETHLAQNGYRAETWHPVHGGSATEAVAPGGNSSSSSSSQQQSQQQQSHQQQSQSGSGSQQNRQRENNASNRPRWVSEMAASLQSQSTDKGNQNGISS